MTLEYLTTRRLEAYAIARRYKAERNEAQAAHWFKIAANITRKIIKLERN